MTSTAALSEGPADVLLPVAEEIRREAMLPLNDPLGRPLPLAAHWNTGKLPNGFSPDYQMDMIRQGHYLLPWFQMPDPKQDKGDAYYEEPIKTAAKLGLPIGIVGTQWEKLLTTDTAFFDLPADRNPNVVGPLGGIQKKVSPFGPLEPWGEVGARWTSSPLMKRLQAWYPDPPMILFVSNNEHDKLNWTEAETDRRYLKQHGLGKDGNFRRKVIGDGWIPRYRNLLQGMRESLSPGWAKSARFIGYSAFETWSYGLQLGWERYSLHTEDRISPWPQVWQGASVPYYLRDKTEAQTDYTVYSPQLHAMNWLFMLEEAQRLSPGFWFEISTWDGHGATPATDKRRQLAAKGGGYGSDRYQGFVQFGAWLVRPRVVREFRYFNEMRMHEGVYFDAVMAAVDRVHNQPVLRRFWRKGEPVANPARQHPFQTEIPAQQAHARRWYLLSTNLDPAGPWNKSTELPVFAIALVLGDAPKREWLIYAFSPLFERKDVKVTVPGYRTVGVAASPSGVFSVVHEETGEVTGLAAKPSGTEAGGP